MIRRPLVLLLPLALLLAGCMDRELPTAVAPDGPSLVLVQNTFTQVSAGLWHNCALRSDGVVECWGSNSNGQAPTTRTPLSGITFTEVSAGGYHTCALRSDGVVECWGSNSSGQAPTTRTAPSGTTFDQVSAGMMHTCALRSDGVVACWGWNGHGQAPAITTPPSGTTFTQVSAGGHHNCALRSDRGVTCWGSNFNDQATPPSGTTFTQVSAGHSHTCALRSDGTARCWGSDDYGQAPGTVGVFSGTRFIQVSAGGNHTYTLYNRDGVVTLVSWGSNSDGQRTSPSGTFTQVSAGFSHTCALRNDGVVRCWGNNTYGQANHKTASTTTVLPTATFSHPETVAAGRAFSLSLTDAQVPGHPSATTFTYAFDCGDGTGYGAFGASNTADCPTTAPDTRTVKATVMDQDGHTQEYTGTVTITDPVLPTATFNHPETVEAGSAFSLSLTDAAEEGNPDATFTYAFDCGDGTGYGAFSEENSTSCPTSTAGERVVKGKIRDQDGDTQEYTSTLTIDQSGGGFTFTGFFAPVDNDIVNVVTAGRAVPVKFSLGGDYGLSIFDSGYPSSQRIPCDGAAPEGLLEGTVTAGSSSLSYDDSTDQYNYVWKSERNWAGTCRRLTLQFTDGTSRTADFRFTN